jgi:hypothetical protein
MTLIYRIVVKRSLNDILSPPEGIINDRDIFVLMNEDW